MERQYELTLVFPADIADKDKEEAVKKVSDFVTAKKGKVVKAESWGKKYMAYTIQGHNEGVYEHFVLEMDPSEQTRLDSMLRVEEGMLRYLFVRV